MQTFYCPFQVLMRQCLVAAGNLQLYDFAANEWVWNLYCHFYTGTITSNQIPFTKATKTPQNKMFFQSFLVSSCKTRVKIKYLPASKVILLIFEGTRLIYHMFFKPWMGSRWYCGECHSPLKSQKLLRKKATTHLRIRFFVLGTPALPRYSPQSQGTGLNTDQTFLYNSLGTGFSFASFDLSFETLKGTAAIRSL